MGWDIDVKEKVYQRLANEIFSVYTMVHISLGQNCPHTSILQKKLAAALKL